MKQYIEYKLIRSDRKTIAIQIKSDGRVIVRAPRSASRKLIEEFLLEKKDWIVKHLKKMEYQQAQQEQTRKLSEEDLEALKKKARSYLRERVEYFAPIVGVDYGRITIRSQKSRWGSCSSAGNLNFNCLLMLTPPEVIDSVVVHELCHRLEMNHSPRFYQQIYRVYPEYDYWHGWLKEHGRELLYRLP